MTILGGDYPDVEVERLDLVGYAGDGTFVIISPNRHPLRKLPEPDILPGWTGWGGMPWCIRAKVKNNQIINFNGTAATLHDINGEWHVRFKETGKLEPLAPFTFFEIGNAK